MAGLNFFTAVSPFLILIVLAHIQGETAGTCSTGEMKRAAVNDALSTINCEDYDCAFQKILQAGSDVNNPATSCTDILNIKQFAPCGYYWLQSANGSAVQVYCDMTLTCKGVGGGWMQVAKLDMTNTTHQCPPGTRLRIHSAKRLCENTRSGSGCSSTIFDVHGIEYRQVCGKIIAYQYGSPDAFVAFNKITRSNNVDDNYLDGISLTHGRSPRKHIWTFVGANDESGIFPGAPVTRGFCSCTNTSRQKQVSQPPSFVGDDYFCDTGSEEEWQNILYPDDPLWDGAGCGPANTCCSLNSPPWFLKQLPSSTTDNIEMRICRDEDSDNEDIKVETIELYIR